MKSALVSKDGNKVTFSMTFTPEEFNAAVDKAYKANRNRFQIDGFRKGKAPRKMIENMYGADIFHEEAIYTMLEDNHLAALDELVLEPIDKINVDKLGEVKKGEPVEVTCSVLVFPEIDVKKYKGLEVEKLETKIGKAEVEEELKKVQKSQARMETVEGRDTKEGDTVIIDFEGSVDGEKFQGGSADNFELKLGSGQFIPGFEDQLIGKKAGDEVDVEVTFPADYHAEDLAGKPALFKTKIHEVKEELLPEIDDELASDVSEFETLDEYKKDLKKKLQKDADDADESVMKDRALEALFNANKIDAPEVMIQSELDNMIYDMQQNLAYQGIKLDDYLKWMGKTVQDLKNDSREEAEKRVKTRILLKNIIRLEKIEAAEAEVEEEIKKFGEQYGQTVEEVKKMVGENVKYFAEDVQTKKAIDFVFENAKKIAEKKEAKKAEKKPAKKADKADKDEKAEKKPAKKTTKKAEKEDK